MKTETTKSRAIIIQEGRLIEDAKESTENRRLFWLIESEGHGIRFRILGDTPAQAISSAESLAQEIGKYRHVRARAVYRWDTRIGLLEIYSRDSKAPPQRLKCGDITGGVPQVQATPIPCPLETAEELMKKLIDWENRPENPHVRSRNPFDNFSPTPG